MKVYVDEKDIGRKITTYNDWQNTQQGLYVFGKEKIEVLSLADYTKQVRKGVCEEIKSEIIKHHAWKYEDCYTNSDVIECVLDVIDEILDQLQGNDLTKNQ